MSFSINKSRAASLLISVLGVVAGAAHAQQVALLDSGVDPSAGLNIVGGFNYFSNSEDTSDVSERAGEGHGTVAARVAAEAFDGEIVPFVITDGGNELAFEDQVRVARDNALSDILGQDSIRVVGISWGTRGVTGASASLMPQLSSAGKFVAIMAGNEFSNQPNALATASFNLDGVIVVGGGDAQGNLLPQTNRAGTTANRYVVANGLPDETGAEGGSSWAAARISGIAGAVFQQNPDLTAEEVADVILQSAEDRGDPGTDRVYGRGAILNAEQVLNNVMGPVEIPTTPTPPPSSGGGGGGGGGGGAILLVGGALAAALVLGRKSKGKLEKTLVLDSYGRAFEVDLNPHISVQDEELQLDDFFASLQQTSLSDGLYLPSLKTEVAFAATGTRDKRLDMIEYFAMPNDRVVQDAAANFSVAMRSQLREDLLLDSGYQVSAAQSVGLSSALDYNEHFGATSFISGQAFDSVLAGFSQQANTASLRYLPGSNGKSHLQLGLVSVSPQARFDHDSLSTILQGGYEITDRANVRVQFGQLEEQGSLLGGAAGGVFGVERATTYALNLSSRVKLGQRFAMVANYGIGKTKVSASEGSLLSGFTDLRSDWYSVGLLGNSIFNRQDQLGIAFAQPLKIRSGFVDMALPTGRALSGDILFDREHINLADTGATERSIEGYYRTKLNEALDFGAFAGYRSNPNHSTEQGSDWLVMATLQYRR